MCTDEGLPDNYREQTWAACYLWAKYHWVRFAWMCLKADVVALFYPAETKGYRRQARAEDERLFDRVRSWGYGIGDKP